MNPDPADWLSYRRTYDVTGFSPLKQIDRTSIGQLRLVWSYPVRDSSRWEPTPIVANGIMYIAEGSGRVIAFDVQTGDVVWIHERHYPEDIAVSEAFQRSRGVAIYQDKIYWGTADCYLVALDARTGKLVWEVKTGDYHTGEGHDHPPLIAEGKVFLGHAGGDRTAQGRFRAFDSETGKLIWTLNTAPRPGDSGYETWTKRDVPPLGAAPWNTASYDPELHLVYFSTGQPEPWAEPLRGPGDALYSNSVVAVEAGTGKIRWYFQLAPEDSWDRAAFENVLVDLVMDGKPRKALIQTGKIGWGVVLDRETGEFLKSFRTGYDNVITGWTSKGRPIINPKTQPQAADVDSGKVFDICPHTHGARNLDASSYSPLTHLYYLGVNNACMNASIVSAEYAPGRRYQGVNYSGKLAPGYDFVGEFVAINPVTGERAWTFRPPSGSAMTASALATAGGVVFGGTADRQLFALNTDTGALLWQTRLSGDISGAPVTFEAGGTQYVAVGVGGRTAWTTSLGPLTGVDIPKGSGAVYVFALPSSAGTASLAGRRQVILSTSESLPAPNAPSAKPAVRREMEPVSAPRGNSVLNGAFTSAQAARGEQAYSRSCSRCHSVGEHSGSALSERWGGRSVGEMFSAISTTMPENNPGGLPADDYASIVAFFLRQSGYSPGTRELPADPEVLKKLTIERAK